MFLSVFFQFRAGLQNLFGSHHKGSFEGLTEAPRYLLGCPHRPIEGVRIPKAHRGGSWRPPKAYRRSLAGDPSWSPQSPGALGARARALTRSPKAGEILRGPLGSRREGCPSLHLWGVEITNCVPVSHFRRKTMESKSLGSFFWNRFWTISGPLL